MPQMAPSNWISLFLTFLFTYLMFNTLTYYFYTPIIKKYSMKFKKINSLNWKW